MIFLSKLLLIVKKMIFFFHFFLNSIIKTYLLLFSNKIFSFLMRFLQWKGTIDHKENLFLKLLFHNSFYILCFSEALCDFLQIKYFIIIIIKKNFR